MAREKKVEDFDIETNVDEVKVEIPKDTKSNVVVRKDNDVEDELISCLSNERIIIRHINKPSIVTNPNHVLYGGMSENAHRTFVVPKLSSGVFVNVLTKAEKDFLEYALNLEKNSMSVHKKVDNFWDDSNQNGVNRVRLGKQDNYLDLSDPVQYIKYKILLANKDLICPSIQELQDRPKATYQFVIVRESDENKVAKQGMSMTMACYKEFGRIEDDKYKLKTIIELLTGRPISSKEKIENMHVKVNELIQSDPKSFLRMVSDTLLDAKVLIFRCVENGLISKKNNLFYLTKDGSPLCELGEESTLNIAAKFISKPKRQELRFMLEEKVKE